MNEQKTKVCSKCKIEKSIEEFWKDNTKKSGVRPDCKVCSSIRQKQERVSNPEKYKIKDEKNRKKYREKIKKRRKIYYNKNRKKENQNSRNYNKNNRSRLREYNRKYFEFKRETDLNFKIKENLKGRLNRALKGNFKSGSAVRDLGCSIKEFKNYLEQQFYLNSQTGEQMSWENYGEKWHIHHIVPLYIFDLTNREQFLKACHYTNMKPLWKEDHLKEHNKKCRF